jgi:hypothetical protein
MRHEKNLKGSSSQGWRKGGYHFFEVRISTEPKKQQDQKGYPYADDTPKQIRREQEPGNG